MRYLSVVLLLALTLAACSDSDSPVTPPPPDDPKHELRPFYYWTLLENGDPNLQETLSDRLVLRFRDGTTKTEQASILLRYGLRTIVAEHGIYRQTVVGTSDAFATAPKLWREGVIESVGPVFDFSADPTCGLSWPNNGVILKGDLDDPSIVAALEAVGATLVNQLPSGTALYALPWDDSNRWFDFCNEIEQNPAVEYADPNLVYQVCPASDARR